MACTSYQILSGWSDREAWDGWGVWHMAQRRTVYMVLVGKPGGRRPPRRPGVGCIHLAQDRDTCRPPVNMVMTLRVHG